MIKKLTMRDFRGIAQGEMGEFAQINLLVGPNNSGKSSILEALYLATTADTRCTLLSKVGETVPVTVTGELDLIGQKPMARIWQRHNFADHWADAPAVWNSASGNIEFFGMHAGMYERLGEYKFLTEKKAKEEFIEGDEQRIVLLRVQKVTETVWVTEDGEEKEEERDVVPPFPTFVKAFLDAEADSHENHRYTFLWFPDFTFDHRGLAGWSVETDGQIPVAEQTFLHDFHATHRHFPRVFIDRGYKVTRYWQRQLGEHFAYIFDLPTNPLPYISFSPYIHDVTQFEVLIDQYGRMVSIDTWGDGARHAMKLLVPLILLRDDAHNGLPGVVLWEDPELFLHPNALYRLMHEVLMLIKDYPIQLFITTQSLEAVASLTTLVQDMGLSPDVLRAFRQYRQEGELRVARFEYSSLKTFLELGMDPRFWEANDLDLSFRLGEFE